MQFSFDTKLNSIHAEVEAGEPFRLFLKSRAGDDFIAHLLIEPENHRLKFRRLRRNFRFANRFSVRSEIF